MVNQQHPRIRLPHKRVYEEPGYAIHVWFGLEDRSKQTFADPKAADLAVEVLTRQREITGVRVYMYCVMPDHVHLVIEPSSRCSVQNFIGRFKNFTRKALKDAGIVGLSWQD